MLAKRDDASGYVVSPQPPTPEGSSITVCAWTYLEHKGWLSLFAKFWWFSLDFRAPLSHNHSTSLQPTP